MKVLSWIELYDLGYDKLIDYYNFFGMENHNLKELHYLYKEPFTVETITKYFDGWVLSYSKTYPVNSISKTWTEDTIHYFHDEKYGIALPDDLRYMELHEGYGCMYDDCVPKVLDHFIVICQISGIELKWKKR